MNKFVFIMLLWGLTWSAHAELRVFACEPEWAALAETLAGDKVLVYSATTAYQDPHRIEARPSLIAQLRRADLLICSGAELEQGWLPMLLRQAGNGGVQPGQSGHLEAAHYVDLLGTSVLLDRSQGDVHGAGNPHFHLDPRNFLAIATELNERLRLLDSANSEYYQQRYQLFRGQWQQALQRWQQQAAPLKGVRMVVQHKDWIYLFDWLGIELAATLEPKPGIAPSASHLTTIKRELTENPAKLVIYNSYQSDRGAKWLAQQVAIPMLQLPYSVGGAPGAGDLFSLFDVIIGQMLAQLK